MRKKSLYRANMNNNSDIPIGMSLQSQTSFSDGMKTDFETVSKLIFKESKTG